MKKMLMTMATSVFVLTSPGAMADDVGQGDPALTTCASVDDVKCLAIEAYTLQRSRELAATCALIATVSFDPYVLQECNIIAMETVLYEAEEMRAVEVDGAQALED